MRAVHACLSLFKTEKPACFRRPRLQGVTAVTNAVWHHASSVSSWMVKQQPASSACTNICSADFN